MDGHFPSMDSIRKELGMASFNADDKMHSHPKSRIAGLEAMGLGLLAGTYCTDYLTDGAVQTRLDVRLNDFETRIL
jgi:hypothetical protein